MKLRLPWGMTEQPGSAAGSRRAGESGRASASANTAAVNRQLHSLAPGQTLRGEVAARNGNEIQIRLADDTVIQARVDQNMNLEVGKTMTFEVRNNGSTLTLSPLFENTAADVNVWKALDMAGIPVNETTVSMTGQMMQAGLSVDRNALQTVYREITSFPQAEISDIVNLHKLGMAVNDVNVEQMISYRNLTHQLTAGMDGVLAGLPDALEGMAEEGNLQSLAGMYQELFALVQEGVGEGVQLSLETWLQPETAGGSVLAGQESASGEWAPGDAALSEETAGELPGGMTPQTAGALGIGAGAEGKIVFSERGNPPQGAAQEGAAGSVSAQARIPAQGEGAAETAAPEGTASALSERARGALSDRLLELLPRLSLSPGEESELREQLRLLGMGRLSADQLFQVSGRMLQAARAGEDSILSLHRIFSEKAFQHLLTESLRNVWSVKPEELAQPGRVEELYRRMDRQLKGIVHALEEGGQETGGAFRSCGNLVRNLDFLNQLNQMYAYVQLPLRLSGGQTQGDLYVYTNRRKLSAKEGKISALLHLDMEHLGPVDVYVAMEQSKVSTRFFVRDDEMLSFLEANMHLLTKRLSERGYDCSCSMSVREKGQETSSPSSGIGPILEQEKGLLVARYAFDVRT